MVDHNYIVEAVVADGRNPVGIEVAVDNRVVVVDIEHHVDNKMVAVVENLVDSKVVAVDSSVGRRAVDVGNLADSKLMKAVVVTVVGAGDIVVGIVVAVAVAVTVGVHLVSTSIVQELDEVVIHQADKHSQLCNNLMREYLDV